MKEAVAMHHTPRAVTSDGYDLLGALAISHALLAPNSAHAVPVGHEGSGIDESYLARLNAPFDWKDAQQRVQKSAAPTD